MKNSIYRNSIIILIGSILIFIFSQFAFAAQIKLAWNANTETDLAGYKVYWGTSSRSYGSPVDAGKVTQYTLTGLTSGISYFVSVTAYDLSNNESGFSSEVSGVAIEPAPVVVIPPTISPPFAQYLDHDARAVVRAPYRSHRQRTSGRNRKSRRLRRLVHRKCFRILPV